MKKLSNHFLELEKNGVRCDLFGGADHEDSNLLYPKYIKTSGEKVLFGRSNTRIVFGSDRPGARDTGYGASGDAGSGSIDIVAEPVLRLITDDSRYGFCDPSFETDAARLFVCGKSDIDLYFNISGDNKDSVGKSCAVVFGDVSRIFARQDIKIVSGVFGEKNAAGGQINKIGKIQLIGNNQSEKLQAGVLGDNIESFLKDVVDTMEKIVSLVDNVVMVQSEFNNIVAKHKHYSPFFGNPTTPSDDVAIGIVTNTSRVVSELKTSVISLKYGLANLKMQYLTEFGGKKIKSKYVELN